MTIKSVKPFKAIVNLGLEYGYTQKKINKESVIEEISKYQNTLIEEEDIYLSCSIIESLIVLNNQKEKHLKLEFINYPKFQLSNTILKECIENLTIILMNKFSQNRVVIEYLDETKMIDKSSNTDSRI
ncbi:hypothetical protein CSC81_10180 [Tenacibaculum discolor]|uniref:Uncharacterized protein n=1 Tax=Tenacibaculum discolor TaxID=361581 RepID=A0A2G1BV03_9FLAO|nr:hypothetical protein [Tenacibaculum discolor]MDP2541552.1 hypothetical protein [Tenacibaculum discolor]PHN97435.1 hypothetical protein CSC81_10180 [Tenacibaculum discolor]PHN99765.1 hypothetical protein CSC82_32320 [Rhodobacteraceae bacterium 4F10]